MCGRYSLSLSELTLLSELLSGPITLDWKPRQNIAPTQSIPIIRNVQTPELLLLHWGWRPNWGGKVQLLINARSETVEQKRTFHDAFLKRRCLIPADSYYEWQATTSGKQPMRIWVKDRPLFYMAGLWSPEGCLILTTGASESLKPIHERMPVIFDAALGRNWLNGEAGLPELKDLLKPLQPEETQFEAVSKVVFSGP